jgi:hypothetical protein
MLRSFATNRYSIASKDGKVIIIGLYLAIFFEQHGDPVIPHAGALKR